MLTEDTQTGWKARLGALVMPGRMSRCTRGGRRGWIRGGKGSDSKMKVVATT